MLCMNCWAGTAQDQSTICDRCEERLIRAREVRRPEIPNQSGVQRSLKLASLALVAFMLCCGGLLADGGQIPDAAVVPVRIMEQHTQAICDQGVCRKINRTVIVGGGSAVVISDAETGDGKKGWALLTARHVVQVEPNQQIEIGLGKQWLPAKVIRFSKNADLAKKWPSITKRKGALPDADDWKDRTGKLDQLIK